MRFDLSFVDGDHSYLGALTDLIQCAKYSAANAVIVVDDHGQIPVCWAVRDFLGLHPGWREIGGVFEANFHDDPFAHLRPSIEGLPFLILLGPPQSGIASRPPTTISRRFEGAVVKGVRFELVGDNPSGRMHAQFFISSIGPRLGSSYREASLAIPAGAQSVWMELDPPLEAEFGAEAEQNDYLVVLVWQGPDPEDILNLQHPPEVVVG